MKKETITFRKKKPEDPPKYQVYAPMGIEIELYNIVSEIASESGLPMRQVASKLIRFALERTEWED